MRDLLFVLILGGILVHSTSASAAKMRVELRQDESSGDEAPSLQHVKLLLEATINGRVSPNFDGHGHVEAIPEWGLIIVRHTQENHLKITRVLQTLRQAKAESLDRLANDPRRLDRTTEFYVEPESRIQDYPNMLRMLSTRVTGNWKNTRLSELLEDVGESTDLEIRVDNEALNNAAFDKDFEVSFEAKEMAAGLLLELLLKRHDLGFIVTDGKIAVTSLEVRNSALQTVIYVVDDLVIRHPRTRTNQAGDSHEKDQSDQVRNNDEVGENVESVDSELDQIKHALHMKFGEHVTHIQELPEWQLLVVFSDYSAHAELDQSLSARDSSNDRSRKENASNPTRRTRVFNVSTSPYYHNPMEEFALHRLMTSPKENVEIHPGELRTVINEIETSFGQPIIVDDDSFDWIGLDQRVRTNGIENGTYTMTDLLNRICSQFQLLRFEVRGGSIVLTSEPFQSNRVNIISVQHRGQITKFK